MKSCVTTQLNATPKGRGQALLKRFFLLLALTGLAALSTTPAAALAAPSATTEPATRIHHTSAVLNGKLAPDTDPGITECKFEWGATAAYGNSAPCNEGNTFASAADVSAAINNLTPGTTYHFRLHVETTSSGPLNGADRSFRPDTWPITHPEIASFGQDGTAASSFTGLYTLAFNQSTRELFALAEKGGSFKTSAIFGFDASSPPTYNPLAPFNPLSVIGSGDQPDIAVDSTALPSAGNVYYATERNYVPRPAPAEYKIYGYSASGSPLPGFPIESTEADFAEPKGCGLAVDSAGHLWVANHQKSLEEYTSAGVHIGTVKTTEQLGICKVAFDSNDDMYVTTQGGEVRKYTAASGYATSTQFSTGAINNVAVDISTHNVYLTRFAFGVDESRHPDTSYPDEFRVAEYDSDGHFLGDFDAGSEANHIAIDSTNHYAYVASQGGKVHVFDTTQSTTYKLPTVTIGEASAITGSKVTVNGFVDPEGLPVTECYFIWGSGNKVPCESSPGSGSGDVAVSAQLEGLTPGTQYNLRLFAVNAEGTNAGRRGFFTTNYPPALSASSATNVTSTSADLNGTINPKDASTKYHFEWGTTAAYGNSAPVPDGDAGSGNADVPVSVSISGLSSNTRYHWRLVAQNANGSSATRDFSFLTLGSPAIETTGAPIRRATSAFLGGRVAPRGFATSYFFEYGAEGPCDSNPCAQTAPRSAGSGVDTELVSEEVSELEPSTTYHYRLVADNGQPGSPVFGQDMTVRTQASDAPLSHGRFPGPPGSDRAWEQVSPPEAGGNPVSDPVNFSADGNRALYQIAGGTPLAEEGNLYSVYLSERSPGGWQPRSLLPPRLNELGNPHWFLRSDNDISTVAGVVLNESNFISRIWDLDPLGGPATKLDEGTLGTTPLTGTWVSDDGSRTMAYLAGNHDPDHPSATGQFYDLTSGTPRLASVLPNGTAAGCGVEQSIFSIQSGRHVISADGARLFFVSCGAVYVRDLDAGQTTLMSPAPVSGLACDSAFIAASPEKAFFWTKSRLVGVDTPPAGCENENISDGDVYSYDLTGGALECVTCAIAGADVFVSTSTGPPAPEESMLLAEDGSKLYFQSPHSLVPGAPEVNPKDENADNTYRLDLTSDELSWVGPVNFAAKRVHATPDGSTILFRSAAVSLDPLGEGSTNAGMAQYYRYDDDDRSLICLSCPVDGAAPRGAVLPLQTPLDSGRSQISDDGETIAFMTPTPLLGIDQNTSGPSGSPENGRDVYEWRGGRYLLVTDGLNNTVEGTEGPSAAGVSPSGRDIFFVAAAQYTPDALDGYRRLYDARLGGGFEYPKPPPPCPLEVCQGIPKGAPEEQAPGTGTFAGPGNVSKPSRATRCAPGKAKRKGRCVAKKPKRVHKAGHKRANHNRRTAR